jgi:hypothetical protein
MWRKVAVQVHSGRGEKLASCFGFRVPHPPPPPSTSALKSRCARSLHRKPGKSAGAYEGELCAAESPLPCFPVMHLYRWFLPRKLLSALFAACHGTMNTHTPPPRPRPTFSIFLWLPHILYIYHTKNGIGKGSMKKDKETHLFLDFLYILKYIYPREENLGRHKVTPFYFLALLCRWIYVFFACNIAQQNDFWYRYLTSGVWFPGFFY